MQAEAVREQINLQQYQPSKDTAAAIEGFPIFSVNYEDMMDMKNDFLFTAEQNGQAVILDDGYFLRKFLFNQDCKIVRVIPVAKSPRLK